MPKKIHTDIPYYFAVCLHADCPQAATCLRQLSYPKRLETENKLTLANPLRCTKDGKCKFYRDSKPVRYARGFTNFQKRMYPGQYRQFMWILIGTFSRNCYYERRRGDTLLSPKEQKIVLNALHKVGIAEDYEFDSYEEHVNWYD